MKTASVTILIIACVLNSAQAATEIKVRVTSVRAGDMITTLTSTNVDQEIKLAGVAAPKVLLKQPYGRRAIKALSNKLLGETITVIHSRSDMMGQIIGKVMLDGRWINQEMVAEGHVWHDPTTATAPELVEAQQAARTGRKGLWGDKAKPVAPWKWTGGKGQATDEKWKEKAGKNTDAVYVAERSNKYHRKKCRRLREGVKEVSRRRAEKWSYKPCSICKP
ncbi:MAG: thermonuclease family protein [Lentisphaerae bacterium]|jgi:micrococcal nuclease|nr:thermonuclease family protein [Lentisphaerota bacterium]MBT4817575.1 thermonuclease family protein [Lentisphaerota bacterium]MBT5608520.1 thermonuclease family protein [Lentisphaerota bacterium]MBT7058528.1 thermonuclease family protein [Lentisphaerota bacterium]MBT7843237.1 thermonuclease family protein [Lentisphaerota bacterium]